MHKTNLKNMVDRCFTTVKKKMVKEGWKPSYVLATIKKSFKDFEDYCANEAYLEAIEAIEADLQDIIKKRENFIREPPRRVPREFNQLLELDELSDRLDEIEMQEYPGAFRRRSNENIRPPGFVGPIHWRDFIYLREAQADANERRIQRIADQAERRAQRSERMDELRRELEDLNYFYDDYGVPDDPRDNDPYSNSSLTSEERDYRYGQIDALIYELLALEWQAENEQRASPQPLDEYHEIDPYLADRYDMSYLRLENEPPLRVRVPPPIPESVLREMREMAEFERQWEERHRQ